MKKPPGARGAEEVGVGLGAAEDDANYKLNGEQALTATPEFFMPSVDDPFECGRIADCNAISDVYAMGGTPIMAWGDLNDQPGSRTYGKMKEKFLDSWELIGKGEGFTIPAEKPDKRIDYIWLSDNSAIEPLKIWVPQTDASDHLPVVGEFSLR